MAAWPYVARGLFREPLVVFALAGAAIFAIDHTMRRDVETIRITPSVREEIARALDVELGRAPEESELDAGIARWKREQALYREGLKMGLLDDDPFVRAHVAAKLLEIARQRDVLPAASDGDLRDFLARHRSEYATPPRFDFDQVFVSKAQGTRSEAEAVLSRLRAGAPPEGLGDWFPRGTRFTHESAPEIAQLLGEQAAKEIPAYAVGEWNLVQGPQGFHAVRVLGVDRGEPDFERLRRPLALGLEAERREAAAQALGREIEGRYRFVRSE